MSQEKITHTTTMRETVEVVLDTPAPNVDVDEKTITITHRTSSEDHA